MHEPVEDGVGEGGFADVVMPGIDRELAGDQGGLAAVAMACAISRWLRPVAASRSSSLIRRIDNLSLATSPLPVVENGAR